MRFIKQWTRFIKTLYEDKTELRLHGGQIGVRCGKNLKQYEKNMACSWLHLH